MVPWQIEATKSTSIKSITEKSKEKLVTSLTCHVCHSESSADCFNFTESGENFEGFPQTCDSGDTMCVVKKFAFTSTYGNGTTSPMKTFSIKRNCSKKCEDGCVVMGERTRLYVCSQCCSTPLCNVGSGSSSVHLIDNSFQYFHLTSVADKHIFAGTLRNICHLVELIALISFQLLLCKLN
ncbi:hypothetical protein Ocin01_05649 [Orchesella cincta]|uniref:Uncharacterized protein n=1 Tax=Orchesella cincta TaxID=48709 RepID=A0A1D2N6Y3_ORCCI|nr:hypothetical protein Ocin01_05649 [Orchesella cincta]